MSFISLGINSQTVNEAEVKGSRKVNFINKNNQKAIPAVRNFHESIGKKLAGMMGVNPTESHFYDGVTVKRLEPSGDLLVRIFSHSMNQLI